jgi:predicted metalloprotease
LLRLIAAAFALAGVTLLYLGSARAEPPRPAAPPTAMDRLLTALTEDVDRYWTDTFKAAGLRAPQVRYAWIPAGATARSVCGPLGDDAAAYCPGDDTIYIAERFATGILGGTLDRVLPGSARGFGRTYGDFAVAYIVAHEYGHQIQDELGLHAPTPAQELQADCFAGLWANHAMRENRLEEGDVREALNAALAVGDFAAGSPGHHGTPRQRAAAWSAGFRSGALAACGV